MEKIKDLIISQKLILNISDSDIAKSEFFSDSKDSAYG